MTQKTSAPCCGEMHFNFVHFKQVLQFNKSLKMSERDFSSQGRRKLFKQKNLKKGKHRKQGLLVFKCGQNIT